MIDTPICRDLGAGQCGSSHERVSVRRWRGEKNAGFLIWWDVSCGRRRRKKRAEANLEWTRARIAVRSAERLRGGVLSEVRESWGPCRRFEGDGGCVGVHRASLPV